MDRVRAMPMPRVTANNLWQVGRLIIGAANANGAIHTNTVEGFFSLLKRGINGGITTSAKVT